MQNFNELPKITFTKSTYLYKDLETNSRIFVSICSDLEDKTNFNNTINVWSNKEHIMQKSKMDLTELLIWEKSFVSYLESIDVEYEFQLKNDLNDI